MKKKRFLSLILVLCTIACTITAPVAQAETMAEVPAEVSGLLNAIGVTRPEDNIADNEAISRGQFAVYAARLAGERFVGESSQFYKDVPEGSFCFNEVSLLVELGALSVGDDKLFNPNNIITYREACKIIICILGYGDYALVKGGYPMGYEFVAKQKGLSDGLDGIEMTLNNVLRMLYNACHIELLDAEGVDGTYIQWKQGTKTILSLSRDIYYVKGRVDKTDVVSLIDKTPLKSGLVEIGGISVDTGKTGIEKNLGHYVDCYYLKTIDDVPGTVVYYYDKTETKIIDIDDFENYNSGVLSYGDEKANKTKSLNIATNVPILLNGLRVRTNTDDAFNNTNYGHIEITYYNNEIVLVHIKRMKTVVVKYTDELTKTVWDEYRSNSYFNADENKMDKLSIYESGNGTEVGFGYIQAGHVLNIYCSEDDQYGSEGKKTAEVYATKSHITGSVTRITNDKILIDGIEYEVNEELKPYVNITLGINANFYLDAYGEICALTPVTNENMLAYIYAIGENTSPFDMEIPIKVFTFNNEHKVLTIKSSVIIDKNKKTTEAGVRNALASSGDSSGGTTTLRQLVRIKFNSEGVVKSIDTAAESEELREEEGSLVELFPYELAGTQYYNTGSVVSSFWRENKPETIMYRHTIVAIVPEVAITAPKEDQFRLTDKNFFSTPGKYKVAAYKTDFSHPFADVILMYRSKSGGVSENLLPIMVDEVYQKLDKNGDVVWAISGLQSGVAYDFECAADPDFYNITTSLGTNKTYTETAISSVADLSRGDIIRAATDVNGQICEIQIINDFAIQKIGDVEMTADPYWYGKSANYYGTSKPGELRHVNNQFNLTFGHVVDKWVDPNRQWDTFTTDRPSPVLYISYSDTTSIDRAINTLTSSVMVYDVKNDKVFQGTWDDVAGYKSGYGGSDVIISSAYFAPKSIMVYRY